MKMKKLSILVFLLILSTALLLPAAKAGKTGNYDYLEIINTFKMRNIGPATMGGRTVDFAVVESNTSIIYAAVGPSGLWKSSDNGITWFPVFEKQSSVSVGAVSVSPSNPDIVWVGTGEATSRNSVAIGDGVYKSEDGGKTWKHMGLEETRHIDRLLIDPINPDIVYVGARGESGYLRRRYFVKMWREAPIWVSTRRGKCLHAKPDMFGLEF